jgi:hypothetical protein
MSSSSSPSGKSDGFSVGLSTARFLDQSLLDENPAPASPPVPAFQPALAPPPSKPAPVTNRSEEDEDVSAYMSQLLKRSGQAPNEAAPAKSEEPARAQAADVSAQTAESLDETLGIEEKPFTAEQYIPKKTAPEREADLLAFRRLANASARGALNSFETKQQKKECTLSGILAVAGILGSGPLFLFGPQLGDDWRLGALAAVSAAIVFGLRFQQSKSQLKSRA